MCQSSMANSQTSENNIFFSTIRNIFLKKTENFPLFRVIYLYHKRPILFEKVIRHTYKFET